ncbi:hypothetical protein [Nocardia anaemiae]|nr:hypothetical protein [Nocardia anaemiae]
MGTFSGQHALPSVGGLADQVAIGGALEAAATWPVLAKGLGLSTRLDD